MRLGMVTIVVREYDEAIAWYRDKLGFKLIEDTMLSAEKRWVVMSPDSGDSQEGGARLLLAKAVTENQASHIGDQAGGRVFLFLYTKRFFHDYARMKEAGVEFVEEPRSESYGNVVVFRDLYGNKWDFIERA